jgi:FkbM family methyltransferase
MDYIKLINYSNPKRLLDIGAHVGDFTNNIVRLAPNCDAIMVEANPNCEQYLQQSKFGYDMVALSDKQGKAELFVEKANAIGTGTSLYKENTDWYADGKFEKVEVELDTLDNRKYFGDEVIDLIKMDVQGAELDILNGGRKTITRAKYVLIETSLVVYNQGAPMIDAIVPKMKEYGFYMEDILDYLKLSSNQIAQMDILFKNSYIF